MDKCYKCGTRLSSDEIGLNFKMINRGVDKFLCFDCLGKMFNISRERLLELIEHFRKAGCSMFK